MPDAVHAWLAVLLIALAIMLGDGILVVAGLAAQYFLTFAMLVAVDRRVSAFRAIRTSCSSVSGSQGLVGLIAISILLYDRGMLTLVGWILLAPAQVLMAAHASMRPTDSR